MGVAVSAHELLRVRDCATPGCIYEAENGSLHCARHEAGEPAGGDLLSAILGVAGEAVVAKAPTKVDEHGTVLCKVDGCEEPANTKYDRGIFAKLCEGHMDSARNAASERGRTARSRSTRRPAPQVSKPEPEPLSSGVDGFEARAARLVDLGRRVDEARAELEEKQTAYDDAVSEWTAMHVAIAVEDAVN